jgi:hypothetical protein
MLEELLPVLKPVLDRLLVVALGDAELRGRLHNLGQALVALTHEPPPAEPAAVQPPAPVLPEAAAEAPPAPPAAPLPEPAAPAREVSPVLPERPTPAGNVPAVPEPAGAAPPEAPCFRVNGLAPAVGRPAALESPAPPEPARPGRSAAPGFGWQPGPVEDEDLTLIESRCRLKAEGARWAAERQRQLKDGADYEDISQQDRDIITRARALADCFLWMCRRDAPLPADLTLYDQLAGCFEATAEVAAVLTAAVKTPGRLDLLEQGLRLAAEAQSALRGAVAAVGGSPDGDQVRLFHWVRAAGQARGVWIGRYMRQDDPADPAGWSDLKERVGQLDQEFHSLRERERRQRKLHDKLRYALRRIQAGPEADPGPPWQALVETVTGLVQEGVPPSNSEVRDALLPILEDLPEDLELPKPFQLVLREIDRYLASRPTGPAAAEPATAEEVRRAGSLLRGRSVVLIGGERRPQAAEALTAALGLKTVIWIDGHTQTYTAFEPHVANPDVAVVLLAIRWASHGFGDVKVFCEKYGKPLIHLPGGYNPNQVAYHILNQAGERLNRQNGRPTP